MHSAEPDSSIDSTKKLKRIPPREKPSTRKVPTSRARRATAAYIVFIAAKQLPTAMMTATKVPRNPMGAADDHLRVVVFLLRDGIDIETLIGLEIIDQRSVPRRYRRRGSSIRAEHFAAVVIRRGLVQVDP